MMVVVKTDTNIYLNVEGFCANGEDYARPGLYIKPVDYDEYVTVIYCDVGKAKMMLDGIANIISGLYAAHRDGFVLEIHDGKIDIL